MDTDVSPQVVLQSEPRSTRLTCEHLPPVAPLVCAERPPLYKSFATHRALEGMLPGVNALMALQREGVPEALPALGALVRFLSRVNDLVSLEAVFSLEGLLAGGAGEWPHVRVHHLVSLQVHLSFEHLLTERALQGGVLPLLVPQQVVLERLRVPEPPGALVAGERPLLPVSVPVLHQVELPAEALGTDLTYKLLPFSSHSSFRCVLALRGFGFCRVGCGRILFNVYTREEQINVNKQELARQTAGCIRLKGTFCQIKHRLH